MFYSGEQRASNSAIFTWLASTKARRHVLTKGLKLYFQKSLMNYTVFATANSHDKVSMTNESKDKDICNKKTIDKIFSCTRANKVCHRKFAGVHWALGSTTSQAGISVEKITGINSTINPLVVCARLIRNKFAGDMF